MLEDADGDLDCFHECELTFAVLPRRAVLQMCTACERSCKYLFRQTRPPNVISWPLIRPSFS